jgi:hypothetical protein
MQPLKDASDVDLDRVLEALGAVSGTASGPEPG